MGLEDDIAFFEQVPTFAALGKQALRILAIGAETRTLQNGAVLFYAGELAEGGYVVQDGSLLLEPNSPQEGKKSPPGPARWWANWRCSPIWCARRPPSPKGRRW